MPRKGKQIGEKGNPKAERLVGTQEKGGARSWIIAAR
jgi:hypothetical protein